jgi:hypothetical protein
MEPFAKVSKALRDLECDRNLCCNRARGIVFAVEKISSLDKHSVVGKPDNKKDGDDFVETPGVDESESGSSCTPRANKSASS